MKPTNPIDHLPENTSLPTPPADDTPSPDLSSTPSMIENSEETAQTTEAATPPEEPDTPDLVEDVLNHPEYFQHGDLSQIIGFAPQEDAPADFSLLTGDSPETLSDREPDEALLAFDDLSAAPPEKENGPRIIRKRVIKQEKGGGIKRITFGIVYLISVLCIGFLLGMTMITVGNDVFAFVKDESLYEITIDDPKMSLHDLSEYLKEEGIIEYPWAFRLYVGLKNEGSISLKKGTYMISPSYNYDKILVMLDPPPVQEEITITISEGMTIDDMIDLFVEKGIGTREGFEDAIENGEFDYWFLKELEPNAERFYRLEGYLYPDTYRFFTNSSETAVLKKLLNNFNKKVPKSYKDECEALGITLDQAVILASLIEAECLWVTDFELVSGVFHNRLNDTSFNGRFDSDATIQYYLRHTTGARKEELTEEDLQIDSPYNSRLYGGYPPGPICNPSLNALMAAIYPNTEEGFKYFVAQANGYNLYAKTYSEHLKNVETVRKEQDD